MSKKTIVAIIACAGLWIIAGAGMREGERGITRIDFSAVDADSIDSIEISGANSAALVKQDDKWTIGGKRADGGAAKRLAEAIPKMSSSLVITSSSERYEDLEVGEEKGVAVKAMAKGTVVAEFVVGKSSRGGSHVRIGDDVYSVSGVFPGTFNRDSGGWRDKKLYEIKLDDVSQVSVSLAGKTGYTLVKEGDAWQLQDKTILPEGFRFDSAAAKRMASSLVSLRVRDFVAEDPGADKTGLSAGYDSISFTGKDGTQTIQLGKMDSETKAIYVRQKESGELASLNEYTVKSLRKEVTDLRDLSLMDFDDKTIVKLEVRAGTDLVVFEKQGEGEAEKKWAITSAQPTAPEGFELGPNMVSQRLASFKRSKALGVSAAASSIGKASGSITATDTEGNEMRLSLGAGLKHDNRDAVLVQGNIDSAVYVLAKSTGDSLIRLVDSFKKPTAPPPGMGGMGGMGGLGNLDPKQLQGLPPELRKQLEQQMQQQKQQQEMMKRIQAQQQK